ncbi:hypothetical protein DB41_HS00040 [Neochlamydia sp. TUME1]|nr:hypothetical protein DB41_HS00040 [Neochlamydia sp. TUME1]
MRLSIKFSSPSFSEKLVSIFLCKLFFHPFLSHKFFCKSF